MMSHAANTPSHVETDVFDVSGTCDALAQFLDAHHEQAEVSDGRWPMGRTILFSVGVSVAMWAGIFGLISIL